MQVGHQTAKLSNRTGLSLKSLILKVSPVAMSFNSVSRITLLIISPISSFPNYVFLLVFWFELNMKNMIPITIAITMAEIIKLFFIFFECTSFL